LVDVKTHSSALPQLLPQLLLVALSLGGAGAHAANIGHARLLSAAGQPLRLVVPVTALTADEAATLSVRMADPAAWRQHRLTPPVALDMLRVDIQPGLRADARNLVISAAQPPQGAVVDMLLDVTSASGQRRVQVSVLVAPPATQPATGITPPRIGAAASVFVQRGDVLWRIARQHQYADVTLYQMLAALYQTNRAAFMRENMNWLRAGAKLAVPDAATVRAIDPLAARRLFLAHQDAFFRHRAGRAGVVTAVAMLAAAGQAMPVDAESIEPPDHTLASDTSGDRVRLSGATPFTLPDQTADEHIAHQRAQRDAALRVAQLERNLSDLNQALQAGSATPAPAQPPAAGIATANRDSTAATDAANAAAITTDATRHDTQPASAASTTQPAGITATATANLAAPATITPATPTDATQANQPAHTNPVNPDAATAAPPASPTNPQSDAQPPSQRSNTIWVWAAALGAAFLLVLAALLRRNKAPAPPPSVPDDLADDAPSPAHEAMLREQFAKQLKTIDLNLGLDDTGAGARDAGPSPR